MEVIRQKSPLCAANNFKDACELCCSYILCFWTGNRANMHAEDSHILTQKRESKCVPSWWSIMCLCVSKSSTPVVSAWSVCVSSTVWGQERTLWPGLSHLHFSEWHRFQSDIQSMRPERCVCLNVAIYLKCNCVEDGNEFKYNLLIPKGSTGVKCKRQNGKKHLTTVSVFPIGKIKQKKQKKTHPSEALNMRSVEHI